MTIRQIAASIREEKCVVLPDGRSGYIEEFSDVDWRNFRVTVTLESGERVKVSQYGEIKLAVFEAHPSPFSGLVTALKTIVMTNLGEDKPD